jgi:hypothetical protein
VRERRKAQFSVRRGAGAVEGGRDKMGEGRKEVGRTGGGGDMVVGKRSKPRREKCWGKKQMD